MNINCIVDVASREVSFQDTYRIASYDHNVDVIHFSVEPIEDFSLNTSSIKIAAQGPNKSRHDYAVDPSTVSIEEETGYITFDWPIPAGVTEMPLDVFKYGDKGQLIFAVCAEIISGSTVSKAWHSDDGIITVVAHLEPEAGGGEEPEEEATNRQMIGQLQTATAILQREIGGIASGTPPTADSTSEMDPDESTVYINTTDEKWYYWDGTAFQPGGTYGGAVTDTTLSISGAPADAKAVGDALSNITIEVDDTLSERGKAADAKAVGDALAEKADSSDVTALDTRVTAVEGDVDALSDDLADADERLDAVASAIIESSETTIATAGSIYSNGLNTTYVWMLKTPIPRGSIPSLTVIGYVSFGEMTVYFFSKNASNTYTVKHSVTLTTVSGDNPITIPDGLTDDSDIYIGFYSTASGIRYNTNNANSKEYARCAYADIESAQIAMTGTYKMDFNMNLSYRSYHNYLDDLDERIDALENASKDFVIVDASGNGDYTTVIDAITTEPENTVIIVKSGVYEQDMTACLKKRIILVGTDRNTCIIRDTDGRYGHHPLYISCGYFENLTIESPYVSGTSQEVGVSDMGAYAVHIDTDDDYGVGKTTEFHHCNISSDFFPAVGLGMRKDATFIFDDCNLTNAQVEGRGDYSDDGSLGALYFHDSNGVQGDQYIRVKNCILKSKLKYAMCPYMVNRATQNNRVYCDFVGNVLYSDVGKYSDTVWFRRDPFNPTTGIFSIGIGFGNSIATLNN